MWDIIILTTTPYSITGAKELNDESQMPYFNN